MPANKRVTAASKAKPKMGYSLKKTTVKKPKLATPKRKKLEPYKGKEYKPMKKITKK